MKNRTTISYKSARARVRNQKKSKRRIQVIILSVIGLGLIILAVYFLVINSIKSNFTYEPEDVVSDFPLHAIHEMEPSTVDLIAFFPKNEPQPKIVVIQDTYNFGIIGPTDIVTHDFVISNQGNAPLTISRAYTTCGCTIADFSSTIIPPGKVSVVTISLDAGFHDVRGQTVSRGLIIENNDPSNPQIELWVKASVRGR